MNLSLFLIYIFTVSLFILYFFFNDTATTEIYTLSLHDALPILLLAQIADITTTNLGLHRGVGWEANPLMALAQAHLGTPWWVPKLVLVTLAGIAVLSTRVRRSWGYANCCGQLGTARSQYPGNPLSSMLESNYLL